MYRRFVEWLKYQRVLWLLRRCSPAVQRMLIEAGTRKKHDG